MKQVFLIFFLVIMAVMFAACGQKAKITSSWVDPSLNDNSTNNVLVIGMSRDEIRLKLFENVFVDQFTSNGVRAIANHRVSDAVLEPDREIVEAAIKKSGASSVLITHVLDRTSETITLPGTVYYRPIGFYGYYGQLYTRVQMPASDVTSTVVRLESNLYDVSTNSLIWSAQSEVIDPELLRTDFERVVGLLMADMKKKGIIRE